MDQGAQKQSAKDRLKVIVRKLPPNLSEEAFHSAVDNLIANKFSWIAYYPGKVSHKRIQFSRAYINFTSAEAVYEFKAAFDGHVFVGTKGNQYQCAVEYAPFQKVPDPNPKRDARDGTIEKDPDYQEFVRLLESDEQLPSALAQLEEKEKAAAAAAASVPAGTSLRPDGRPIIITPLMEFLQQRHAANPNLKIGLSRGKGGSRREQERKDKSKRGEAKDGAKEGSKEGLKKVLKKPAETDAQRGPKDKPKSGKGQPSSKNTAASNSAAAGTTNDAPRKGSAKPGSKQGGKAQSSPAQGESSTPKITLLKKKEDDTTTPSAPSSTVPHHQHQAKVGKHGAESTDDVAQRHGDKHKDDKKSIRADGKGSGNAHHQSSAKVGGSSGNGAPSSKSSAKQDTGAGAASAVAAASAALSKMSISKPGTHSKDGPSESPAAGEADSAGDQGGKPTSGRRVRAGFTAYVPGALRKTAPKEAKDQG